MRKRLLAVVLAALMGAGVWAAPSPAGASATAVAPDVEAVFVQRLNDLRAASGLAPLAVDDRLVALGRQWAAKMARDGRLSHNRRLPRQAPRSWARLGENVGRGPGADAIHDAFVASPSHHRNLVDRRFDRVGVGVVRVGDSIYVTQQFMATRRARR